MGAEFSKEKVQCHKCERGCLKPTYVGGKSFCVLHRPSSKKCPLCQMKFLSFEEFCDNCVAEQEDILGSASNQQTCADTFPSIPSVEIPICGGCGCSFFGASEYCDRCSSSERNSSSESKSSDPRFFFGQLRVFLDDIQRNSQNTDQYEDVLRELIDRLGRLKLVATGGEPVREDRHFSSQSVNQNMLAVMIRISGSLVGLPDATKEAFLDEVIQHFAQFITIRSDATDANTDANDDCAASDVMRRSVEHPMEDIFYVINRGLGEVKDQDPGAFIHLLINTVHAIESESHCIAGDPLDEHSQVFFEDAFGYISSRYRGCENKGQFLSNLLTFLEEKMDEINALCAATLDEE